ncbi:MAG TPA: toxic anion resistance protein, partial [Leptospiraceae bacterium]|nr:toxic anion resistance protein [Leptospiraceae bacterium]
MENQAAAQAQTSVEEVKNLEQLSPSEQQRVDEIAKSINVTDSQGVIQYGVGTQSKISEFSDSVLKEIKTKDAGENGEILTDLMLKIKDLDVESLSDSDGFLSKIPLISSLVSSSKKFLAKYDTISVQIE